jgi:hypothetical protein
MFDNNNNKKGQIPKKLEDELDQTKFYRSNISNSNDGKLLSADSDNYGHAKGQMKYSRQVKQVFDDSAERSMLDEILGPYSKPAPSKLACGSGLEASRMASSQQKDFTSTLIQRLQSLETESKEFRKKLAEQLSKNQQLESEMELLRKTASQSNKETTDRIAQLTTENRSLRNQILDMEQFLADYGLEWVGYSSDNQADNKSTNEESDQVSFSDFKKAIDSLNNIIYSEPTLVLKDENRKARLANPAELAQKIKVAFYIDGILINRGPFRAVNSISYKQFVSVR